jgi:hypothetical protein
MAADRSTAIWEPTGAGLTVDRIAAPLVTSALRRRDEAESGEVDA